MESIKQLQLGDHYISIGVIGFSIFLTLFSGTITLSILFLIGVFVYIGVKSKVTNGSSPTTSIETELKSNKIGGKISTTTPNKVENEKKSPIKIGKVLPNLPNGASPSTSPLKTPPVPSKEDNLTKIASSPPPPVPPRSYPNSPISVSSPPSNQEKTVKSLPNTPTSSPVKLPNTSTTPDSKTLKKKGISTLRGILGDVVKNISGPSSEKDPTTNNNNQKRKHIADEILTTERVYVGKLKVIVEVYYIPLKTASTENPHPPLSSEQIQTIFGEIVTIYNYNTHFLQKLEERMKSTSSYNLGDLFIPIIDFLKSYSVYINNFSKALSMLETVRKNNNVENLFQIFASNPSCENLDINSLLIMPVQRIPRYILLLTEILKNTDKGSSDYNNLNKALSKMKDLAAEMNENRREAELLHGMYDIQNRLDGFPKDQDFMIPSRRILLDNEFQEKLIKANNLNGSAGGSSNRRYILCNDILLRTKPNGKRIHVKEIIDVNSILFKDINESSTGLAFLSCPNSTDILSIKSLDDNDEKWKETIINQQKINKENRTSFAVKRDSLHL